MKPLVWACGIAALVGTTLLEQGGGEPPNAGGYNVTQGICWGNCEIVVRNCYRHDCRVASRASVFEQLVWHIGVDIGLQVTPCSLLWCEGGSAVLLTYLLPALPMCLFVGCAGDLLSILSALFFAMQIFRTEKTSRVLPEGSNLPYMAIILATVAAASCGSAAAVHWQDAAGAWASLQHVWNTALDGLGPSDTPISAARPVFDLVYTSFCSTDLVLLIELVALQTVSSTEAALIYSLEPVSCTLNYDDIVVFWLA